MLAPLTAFRIAGVGLQIIVQHRNILSLLRDLKSTYSQLIVNEIRPALLDADHAVSSLIRLASTGFVESITEEDYEALRSATSGCKESGRVLSEHLNEVSAYLQQQATKSSHCTVKPIEADILKVEGYLECINVLIQLVAFHTVTALRSATPSDFHATSLTSEVVVDCLRRILDLFDHGGQKIKREDFENGGAVQYCINIAIQTHLDTLHNITNQPVSQALTDTMYRRKSILSRINFRQMSDRIEEIDIAYQKTLEWIFRSSEYDIAWSSFPEFLEEAPDHPYWLNGKAGSGKSTLMRFLIHHKSARTHLQTWSKSTKLELAHFFAWNLGTSKQKTRLGLLQSLIFQVLARDQSLIHQVFPDHWHELGEPHARPSEAYSLVEVKHAFAKMLKVTSTTRCFCFFIDGIDEFEESIDDVADLILSLRAPNLKFVISSRPIDTCLDKFADCPQLRLQELTAHDIRIFIRGKLSSNYVMLDLMNDRNTSAQELIDELESRASGVFLWVKLVVNSLLDGLRKGDNIQDLKIRLRALPPDLGKLYASMLGRMNPAHMRQAAMLFRLVRCASKLLGGQSLPTQFLAVSHNDFHSVINKKPVAFETEKILRWCKLTARQLVSRCCGLVEISWSVYRPDWWYADLKKLPKEDSDLLASHIQFLHRTVAEYLYQEDVWSGVVDKSSTHDSRFEPYENLAYAALHMMKIAPLADEVRGSQAYRWAQILVGSAREYERRREQSLKNVIDEMDLVLQHHNCELSHWSSYIDVHASELAAAQDLSLLYRPLTGIKSFAAFVGMGIYLDDRIEQDGMIFVGTTTQKLMIQTLFAKSDDWTGIELLDKIDAACCLLQHGANPNDTSDGLSLWQCCLKQVLFMICTKSLKTPSRRRRGLRATSPHAESNGNKSDQCSCSVEAVEHWAQLILECLGAGASHTDLEQFAIDIPTYVAGSHCCFARLARSLCRVLAKAKDSMSSKHPETVASYKNAGPEYTVSGKTSSYGTTAISGNASAHLGDNYHYGSNVIVHNYYNAEQRYQTDSETFLHGNLTSSRSVPAPAHSANETLPTAGIDEFEANAVAALKTSRTTNDPISDIGPRATCATKREAELIRQFHWRQTFKKEDKRSNLVSLEDAVTFPDRQCINPDCSTNTTIGWDYVPSVSGLLCYSCHTHCNKHGKLPMRQRANDYDLIGHEHFEDVSSTTSRIYPPENSCALDRLDDLDCHEDPSSSLDSADSAWTTEKLSMTDSSFSSVSNGRSIPCSRRSATIDPYDITSGSGHYMRSFHRD